MPVAWRSFVVDDQVPAQIATEGRGMRWVAPTEKDTANETLEKRL